MEIIIHRVNSIKKLRSLPNNFGTEIDIRSYSSQLILSHEPCVNGDRLENYLSEYKKQKGTLILNFKESGIEQNVLKLVKRYKIKSYFLLISSFASLLNKISDKRYEF